MNEKPLFRSIKQSATKFHHIPDTSGFYIACIGSHRSITHVFLEFNHTCETNMVVFAIISFEKEKHLSFFNLHPKISTGRK